jgi:hypothetical protein
LSEFLVAEDPKPFPAPSTIKRLNEVAVAVIDRPCCIDGVADRKERSHRDDLALSYSSAIVAEERCT